MEKRQRQGENKETEWEDVNKAEMQKMQKNEGDMGKEKRERKF